MCTENKRCCLYCKHLAYKNLSMSCLAKESTIVDFPANQVWSNIRKQLLNRGLECKDYKYNPNALYPDMK